MYRQFLDSPWSIVYFDSWATVGRQKIIVTLHATLSNRSRLIITIKIQLNRIAGSNRAWICIAAEALEVMAWLIRNLTKLIHRFAEGDQIDWRHGVCKIRTFWLTLEFYF